MTQPQMSLPRIESRKTTDLQPHPKNAEIYGDTVSADTDLVANVERWGILQAIVVSHDGQIIAGHRRWDAAKQLGIADVPVTVFPSYDDLDILEALVLSNKDTRQRTNEMIGREYGVLKWVYHERESRQGNRTDISKDEATSGSYDPEVKPSIRAAIHLGVSRKTADRAEQVVGAIDDLENQGNKEGAQKLRIELNKSGAFPAYNKAKKQGYIKPKKAHTPEPKQEPPPKPIPAYLTLEQWQAMPEAERAEAIGQRSANSVFNKQDSDSIEWAMWSWNPVTGCLHNCTYCYARDIANHRYEQGFAPSFLPSRLDAPKNTKVPAEAARSIGYKNVFTCSMADLFGKWVPKEWIDAVLDAVRSNPQWNFLFLTKFPNRLPEFDFPENAWIGTTIDAQARIPNAEAAFAKVNATVKWLSCEPLLEPLTFSRLDLFHWMAIGGASASTQTPEFRPPRGWVEDLERQARNAGCKVYEKTNLLARIREYPGQPEAEGMNIHDAFNIGYVQRDVLAPQSYDLSEVIDKGAAFRK